MKTLSLEEAQAILIEDSPLRRVAPEKPVRVFNGERYVERIPIYHNSRYAEWHAKVLNCVSADCENITNITVQGQPFCVKHTIHKLIQLLEELT